MSNLTQHITIQPKPNPTQVSSVPESEPEKRLKQPTVAAVLSFNTDTCHPPTHIETDGRSTAQYQVSISVDISTLKIAILSVCTARRHTDDNIFDISTSNSAMSVRKHGISDGQLPKIVRVRCASATDEPSSQGLSLNRSQYGDCSTNYNTPAGT